jgi:hypothetical protein
MGPVDREGPRTPGSERLIPTAKLKSMLARAFDGLNSGLKKELGKAEYDRRRNDFVFHMTDWLTDLGALNELYEHPDQFTSSAASQRLYGILSHVIPHLRQAGRLVEGKEIPDPFAENPGAAVAANPRSAAAPQKATEFA